MANARLYEANPFTLRTLTGQHQVNRRCKIKYVGPQYAVMQHDCFQSLISSTYHNQHRSTLSSLSLAFTARSCCNWPHEIVSIVPHGELIETVVSSRTTRYLVYDFENRNAAMKSSFSELVSKIPLVALSLTPLLRLFYHLSHDLF